MFPGWWVALGGLFAYLVYSIQFNSTYGVFIYHLGAEMGWSRSALAGVTTMARVPEMLLAPFVGSFVDRHGSRNMLLVGSLVVVSAYLLLSTVEEIWQLYLYKGVLLAGGALLTSPLVFGVTVNNWFVEKRGRAVALIRMGDTFGTVFMPVLAAVLIEAAGWRWAFAALGIAAVLILAPTSRLFRRRPEDYGLLPDGRRPEDVDRLSADAARRRAELLAADVVWTRRAALRSPAVWAIVLAYGLALMGIVAANVHLVPYVQELGYSITVAAIVVGARGAIGFLANPVFGFLIERGSFRAVAASQFALCAVGMLLFLWFAGTNLGLAASLFVFGLASTGFYVVSEVIWANYFGRISLGTVRGIAQPITAVFAALGPLLVGVIYDLSGGYQLAWVILAVGFLLGAGIILMTGRPRPPTL